MYSSPLVINWIQFNSSIKKTLIKEIKEREKKNNRTNSYKNYKQVGAYRAKQLQFKRKQKIYYTKKKQCTVVCIYEKKYYTWNEKIL